MAPELALPSQVHGASEEQARALRDLTFSQLSGSCLPLFKPLGSSVSHLSVDFRASVPIRSGHSPDALVTPMFHLKAVSSSGSLGVLYSGIFHTHCSYHLMSV